MCLSVCVFVCHCQIAIGGNLCQKKRPLATFGSRWCPKIWLWHLASFWATFQDIWASSDACVLEQFFVYSTYHPTKVKKYGMLKVCILSSLSC